MSLRKLLVTAFVGVSLVVAGCGSAGLSSSGKDATVKSDLAALLLTNDPDYQVSSCTHQQGNQYVCSVWNNSGTLYLNVTDDGTNIYEQGLASGQRRLS